MFELVLHFWKSIYNAHHCGIWATILMRLLNCENLLSVLSISLNIIHKLLKENFVLSTFRRDLFLSDVNKSHTGTYVVFKCQGIFLKKDSGSFGF